MKLRRRKPGWRLRRRKAVRAFYPLCVPLENHESRVLERWCSFSHTGCRHLQSIKIHAVSEHHPFTLRSPRQRPRQRHRQRQRERPIGEHTWGRCAHAKRSPGSPQHRLQRSAHRLHIAVRLLRGSDQRSAHRFVSSGPPTASSPAVRPPLTYIAVRLPRGSGQPTASYPVVGPPLRPRQRSAVSPPLRLQRSAHRLVSSGPPHPPLSLFSTPEPRGR